MDLPVVISGFVAIDVMLSAQVGLALRDVGGKHPSEPALTEPAAGATQADDPKSK